MCFVLCFISIFLAFDFILKGGWNGKDLSDKLKRIDATKTQSNEAEINAMKKR